MKIETEHRHTIDLSDSLSILVSSSDTGPVRMRVRLIRDASDPRTYNTLELSPDEIKALKNCLWDLSTVLP